MNMLRLILSITFLLLASAISAQNSIPVLNSNVLNSNLGSQHTIYLDFNGHFTKNTRWNLGSDDWNPIEIIETPAFDRPDLIQNIWARVAEDYAPFNVNVTTMLPEENGAESALQGKGSRAAIGGNGAWYEPNPSNRPGGVVYIGTFGNSLYEPAFIFTDNLHGGKDYAKNVAEAVSHEVGHTLGLLHNGQGSAEYYQGANGWAPIMGTSYYQDVSQWSKGEYNNATNSDQDDLNIISNKLTYRDDVFGMVNADGTVNGTLGLLADYVTETIADPLLKSFFHMEGIVETQTDVDMFKFTLDEGGDFAFEVDSGIFHDADANLDVLAKLYYENTEEAVWTWDPTNIMGISMTTLSDVLSEMWDSIKAGTYYLSLEGTGLIRDGIEIYSDYASIGTYALSGWFSPGAAVPDSDNAVPEPATLALLGLGLAGLGLAARRRKK